MSSLLSNKLDIFCLLNRQKSLIRSEYIRNTMDQFLKGYVFTYKDFVGDVKKYKPMCLYFKLTYKAKGL